nr:oligopeptide ABC transporter permease protein OppC [Mycoplasma sp. Ms02]
MTSKEFNARYGISEKIASTTLVLNERDASVLFNTVAGKPKKLVIEILKRFFSNWVSSASFVLFITILLLSIIVTFTSPFSATEQIYKSIKLIDLQGKVHNDSVSGYVITNLPVDKSTLVADTTGTIRQDFYTFIGNKNDFIAPAYRGILAEKFLSTTNDFKWENIDGKNVFFINPYQLYKAQSFLNLLEFSGISESDSETVIREALDKLIALNPQLNLGVVLGTNSEGIDIWTQAWVGTWNAIKLAIIVATIQTIIGVAVGAYLGFHVGSWVDTIVMRLIDIFVSPPSLIWLLLFASLFGTSDFTLGFALVFTGWTGPVGGTRMFILTVKDEEYITASKSIGTSKIRLIYTHALPAILGKIATSFVSRIPSIILSVSSLAFLGFFKGSTANLGAILSKSASEASSNIWVLLLPSLILLSVSLSLHFIALGVHDALDPKVIKVK